jgi:hypothetical protein
MKNVPLDPLAVRDIDALVDKVLRGLGNPDPPVDLREVRALLKLDLGYYSSTEDGLLRETISKVKIGAKQLFARPTLLSDVVRKAGLRALWLPDRKRILIDQNLPDLKKRRAEAHEVIHSITPHHKIFLFGDDRETLRDSCHEELEGEANYGAGQLLFLHDRFTKMAQELPRTFATIQQLHKFFGNTLTMTLGRFVEAARAGEALFGIISGHPRYHADDFDPENPCEYFIESAAFRERFGNVTEVVGFAAIGTYANWHRTGPLGAGEVDFVSIRGDRHRFRMETFCNSYNALTLGEDLGPVGTSIVVP